MHAPTPRPVIPKRCLNMNENCPFHHLHETMYRAIVYLKIK